MKPYIKNIENLYQPNIIFSFESRIKKNFLNDQDNGDNWGSLIAD